MPKNYGRPFWRITYSGRLYSAERWSLSVAMLGAPENAQEATQAHADAAINPFRVRMQPTMTGHSVFEWVKVARVGADGLYGDAESVVGVNALAGSAGTGTGALMAPQVSLAVTLRGSNPRAAAGNGRFYLPAPAVTPQSDGRITTGAAQTIADAAAAFINDLNAALPGDVVIIGPQTEKGRAPAYQRVDSVRVGRVLDTVRSRRSSFPEEYVDAATDVTGPFQGGGGDF